MFDASSHTMTKKVLVRASLISFFWNGIGEIALDWLCGEIWAFDWLTETYTNFELVSQKRSFYCNPVVWCNKFIFEYFTFLYSNYHNYNNSSKHIHNKQCHAPNFTKSQLLTFVPAVLFSLPLIIWKYGIRIKKTCSVTISIYLSNHHNKYYHRILDDYWKVIKITEMFAGSGLNF